MRYYYLIGSRAKVYEYDHKTEAIAQRFVRRVLKLKGHKIQVYSIDRAKRGYVVTFWVG